MVSPKKRNGKGRLFLSRKMSTVWNLLLLGWRGKCDFAVFVSPDLNFRVFSLKAEGFREDIYFIYIYFFNEYLSAYELPRLKLMILFVTSVPFFEWEFGREELLLLLCLK